MRWESGGVHYLDHAATTDLRPEAAAEWLRVARATGNASSTHGAGQHARRILEESRERLATVLGCDAIEVVFTSGGTESVNLAVQGLWRARPAGSSSIVLPDGEQGEIVITTFRKEAAPLIRYRTRDISRIIPGECPCGSPFPRLDRIVGRSDDMIKVKGTNIYPAQVEEILKNIEGFSSEYRIVLENEDLRDRMIVQAEALPGTNAEALADELVRECKSGLGIRVIAEVLEIGALPRSEKKTQRVIDKRD